MTIASASLVADLESAVRTGTPQRRVDMLRQMTDLFLSDADRLNEQQITVFDDVLVQLMARVEERTLAELSTRFSGLAQAPREVVRQLAFHEEAKVAAPVLARSGRLSDNDLLTIATTRGQDHLLALSHRDSLNEPLTDVLIKRGDMRVSRALAHNTGAKFSGDGYATLVQRASDDQELALQLGVRADMPLQLLRTLLSKAAKAVRDKLLSAAPPEMRLKIEAALKAIAQQIGIEVPRTIDYTQAQSAVLALNRAGNLNDSAVNRFAIERDYKSVVAALALLSSVTTDAIEAVLYNPKPDGLIVACRASRLSWSATTMIIRNRPDQHPVTREELEEGRQVFEMLSLAAAQRTMRFWSARKSAKKDSQGDSFALDMKAPA